MWNNYGRVFAEYMFIRDFRSGKLDGNIKIEGLEVIENIKKKINKSYLSLYFKF